MEHCFKRFEFSFLAITRLRTMFSSLTRFRVLPIIAFAALLVLSAAAASAQPMRVLWWDVSLNEPRNKPENRRTMARYIDRYAGGARYDVDYQFSPSRGALARHLAAQPPYKMIVITAANNNRVFNRSDLDALQRFYAGSSGVLMLDGTLGIRNSDVQKRTQWPGVNRSSANMLLNQFEAMREKGGGLLIGTDHGRFQASANQALRAIVPRARFSEITNPSRDGEFFGDLLLAHRQAVKPLDILRHWESIPNQGRAPVGRYADFLGRPVSLYTLVEASNKPGGGARKTYISSTINPGSKRFDIAEDAAPVTQQEAVKEEPAPVVDRMPTRKSAPSK